ncbi:hypothetical protein B0H11DRAFT_2427227, partial [Mycena galericulata]
LQKCAYALISQQELSGQQVASYLMDWEDHFTSHTYRNFYWTAFEGFINKELENYQLRGAELSDVSVWDFISRVDKVKKSADRRPHKSAAENGIHDEYNTYQFFDGEAAAECEDIMDSSSPFDAESRTRPRVALLQGHDQWKTHILRVRACNDFFVPVPIGPGIPRRDKKDLRARYCRLMLIFFKPWCHAADLRGHHTSWETAFEEFVRTCAPAVTEKMENMQILHECRDSRDDHFA